MRATFKTVFYVNAGKEKNGVVPIMGRVTINGTIAQFSCKQSIQRTLWDAKGNRAFDKENGAFAKRAGKDRSMRTYQKYLTVRKYVADFIKAQYRRSDISMNELTEDFLRDFCLYLRNEVAVAQYPYLQGAYAEA